VITHDFISLGTQTQLVARLKQLVGFSSSLILLSGTEGAGKTTVSQLLINELDNRFSAGTISFAADMSLAKQRESFILALKPNSVFDPEETVPETLARLIPNPDMQCVLVIENADTVGYEFFDELWQWLIFADQVAPKHKINILLLGNSEFSNHLAHHLKGREQVALEVEVEPLTQKEQQKLLVSCLQDASLTSEQKSEIQFSLSQISGLPADVIAIAEAYMDEKKPKQPSFKQFKLPVSGNKAIAGVAILAGAALLLSLVISGTKKESADVTTSEPLARQSVALQPSASVGTAAVQESVSSATPVVQDSIAGNNQVEGIVAESSIDDSDKTRVVISDQAIQQMSAVNDQASSVGGTNGSTDAGSNNGLDQLKPVVNEIKESSTVVESVPKAKISVPVEKKTQHVAPVIKKTVKKVAPSKTSTTVKKASTKTTTAAASAKGKGFALQLSASGNQVALKKLAQANGLSAKSYIYKNNTTGMFVLLYGDYPSSVVAKTNIAKLPKAIQSLKPWPKSYAQVRKEQTN